MPLRQPVDGEGVFEEVVVRRCFFHVGVAQEGQPGAQDVHLDLQEARFVARDLFEAAGGAADAGFGEGGGDEVEDGGQPCHAVVAGGLGDAVEGGDGELDFGFGHEQAREPEGGGDGGRVGLPDEGVEAQGVVAQDGGVVGDEQPLGGEHTAFFPVFEDAVGQVGEVGADAGAGAGDVVEKQVRAARAICWQMSSSTAAMASLGAASPGTWDKTVVKSRWASA